LLVNVVLKVQTGAGVGAGVGGTGVGAGVGTVGSGQVLELWSGQSGYVMVCLRSGPLLYWAIHTAPVGSRVRKWEANAPDVPTRNMLPPSGSTMCTRWFFWETTSQQFSQVWRPEPQAYSLARKVLSKAMLVPVDSAVGLLLMMASSYELVGSTSARVSMAVPT
jgi:hypothetical protein